MASNSIMLRNSEDWESFWFALEGVAGSSETSVFKFIDVYDQANLLNAPELPNIPDAPELPERPENIDFDMQRMWRKRQKISKQWERYDVLNGWVRQHVHADNYVYMRNEKGLFKQLLALKNHFAPTDRAKELRITRLYNEARVFSDNQPIVRWLDNYQQTYKRAVDLKLPEISGYRAHYDFIYAIKSIDGEYSKYLSIQLEKKRKKDKVPLLTEIIEDFRNHQRQEEASMAIDRDLGSHGKVVAATFKEEAERKDGKDFGEKKGMFEGKECMCGLIHAWVKCFYLNPSLRTTTWKGKKEVFEKINKQLKNPKLKWVVKKYGYDGLKGEKNMETIQIVENSSENTSKSVGAVIHNSGSQKAAAVLKLGQAQHPTQGLDSSWHAFPLDGSRNKPVENDCHLSSKWIIDNGADTHVTNSDRNFEETRKAGPKEILYAGKGAYTIQSYGNVILPLKSNVAGEYLLLKDVAYVSGFMTNCVSLDKLTKTDIHWSSRNPTILEREGDSMPFCYLYQSGSHWIFEEPGPFAAMAGTANRKSMKKRLNKMTAAKAHVVMGHAGYDTINKLQDNCEGIEVDIAVPCPRTSECPTCACAKAHEIVSRNSDVEFPAPSDVPFYRSNQDIIQFEPSYNGHNYATHTQCDTSRYAVLDTHRGKSAAFQASINQIKLVENQFDVRVRAVKTDGEAVFNSKEWVNFTAGKGIVREITVPDTSEQNGRSEAAGKWIVVISRALILSSGVPNNLFSEALRCSTYIYNRLPRKFLGWKTPFEVVNLSLSDKLTDAQLAQSRVTVNLYEQISKQQLHGYQIPDQITKWGSVNRGRFRRELRQFNIDRVDEQREVFHWYKSCSYHTPYSTRSYSLGLESFIQHKHQLGKIIPFLNYHLTSKSDPIIFVYFRVLVDTKRTDPIPGFNIWEETVHTSIIPLIYVPKDPVFIIPLTTGGPQYWRCPWHVQYT
ncbi:hypothetical protein K3495_g3274 [Podosphaera aphanis]|nr:hypothetical protein K3495_g3274 [Podosphaera aphanis]